MARTEPYGAARPSVKYPERPSDEANSEPRSRGPRRYYLSSVLVARAADHCRRKGSLAMLGSLVLALNALHACSSLDGQVMVSQERVAQASGGLSARWVRGMEAELLAAGLVRKAAGYGRRRVLVLVSAEELDAADSIRIRGGSDADLHQTHHAGVGSTPRTAAGGLGVFHNLPPADCGELGSVGTPVPIQQERPFLLDEQRSKERARVQKEEGVSDLDGALRDRGALLDAVARLARCSLATQRDAARLALAASELEAAMGGARPAAQAIEELRPWVLRTAHSNAAALAVSAVRARAKRARDASQGQGKLFA